MTSTKYKRKPNLSWFPTKTKGHSKDVLSLVPFHLALGVPEVQAGRKRRHVYQKSRHQIASGWGHGSSGRARGLEFNAQYCKTKTKINNDKQQKLS
jgi:hypothetical protein